MMKAKVLIVAIMGALIFMLAGVLSTAMAMDVSLITKEELKALMGKGDVVILDVRSGRDWDSSEFKIQGALRADPKKVAAWVGEHAKNKPTVLYCA